MKKLILIGGALMALASGIVVLFVVLSKRKVQKV